MLIPTTRTGTLTAAQRQRAESNATHTAPATDCDFRGPSLGTLRCGCKGAPRFYECTHEQRPDLAVLLDTHRQEATSLIYHRGRRRVIRHTPKPYNYPPNAQPPETIEVDSIAVCESCRLRQFTHPHNLPLRARDLEWISTEQLVADGLKLVKCVDPDTAGIIGVPRSGMIPAAAIATHCHLPLYELTPTGPRQLSAGGRGKWTVIPPRPKFLLVDDSSHSGGAMGKARRILTGKQVTFSAVYTLRADAVDAYSRLLTSPHIFDWNIFNNGQIVGQAIDARLRGQGGGFAVDFDGILCDDPTWQHTDQREPDVQRWLANVRPARWIPRLHEIPAIVSYRLEKHRGIIQAWLDHWGIKCRDLILHPAETFAERDSNFQIAHKAEWFRQSRCSVFVESSILQAEEIAKHSGKIVMCPPARRVLYYGG